MLIVFRPLVSLAGRVELLSAGEAVSRLLLLRFLSCDWAAAGKKAKQNVINRKKQR